MNLISDEQERCLELEGKADHFLILNMDPCGLGKRSNLMSLMDL